MINQFKREKERFKQNDEMVSRSDKHTIRD